MKLMHGWNDLKQVLPIIINHDILQKKLGYIIQPLYQKDFTVWFQNMADIK